MHQSNQGDMFSLAASERDNGRIVSFEADLYPDAIGEWIRWMSSISSMQKNYDHAVNTITISSKSVFNWLMGKETMESTSKTFNQQEKKILELENYINTLENNLNTQEEIITKYKTFELFDSLKNYGDSFSALAQTNIDLNTDSLSENDIYAKNLVSYYFCNI